MLLRSLPPRPSVWRVVTFAVLSGFAALLTLLFITAVPAAIGQTNSGATIYFAAVRSQLLPQDCVRFQWNVEGAQAVAFNQQRVAASGSRVSCSYNDLTSTLTVISQDTNTHTYTFTVRMIFDKEGGFALVSLGLLIVAFALALFIPAPRDYLLLTLLTLIPAIPLFLLPWTTHSRLNKGWLLAGEPAARTL